MGSISDIPRAMSNSFSSNSSVFQRIGILYRIKQFCCMSSKILLIVLAFIIVLAVLMAFLRKAKRKRMEHKIEDAELKSQMKDATRRSDDMKNIDLF